MNSNSMKVCHLSSVHPRRDGRIYHKECTSLSQQGFTTYLVVADGLPHESGNVNIISTPTFGKNRVLRMVFSPLLVAIAGIKTKSEIFHIHDPELIPIGVLLKAIGKRVIYDVHEDVPLQILSKSWIPKHLRQSASIFFNFVEKFTSRFFDGIVAATPPIARNFETKSRDVVVVNNYPHFEANKTNELAWHEKKRQICYFGGISEIRGLTHLIDALAICKVDLLLGGRFINSAYEEYLRNREGWKYVKYLGFINTADVKLAMAQSRIGIVTLLPTPNYLESQPTKLFEYMHAGIPAIASNFPAWRKIVEGRKCGICVDPTNPIEIASTISRLLDDEKLSREMGQRGYKAIAEEYNWENEAKKLIELYSRMRQ